MRDRPRQGVVLLILMVGVSLFLTAHASVVRVDFDACFGNYGASINGERPFQRVAEMSLGNLVSATFRAFSTEHLIVAALGLLPLSPFLVAWAFPRKRGSGRFWIACASLAAGLIVYWTFTSRLMDFYDCDLNGESLALLLAPILYTTLSVVAALVLAVLRWVTVLMTDRE
ncbi:hypothetical protein [Allosphingosinicella deserti]|uniref:Uncharacterized protein n=1 Tax=Allosphingosinicella deserti TaxID=2116704 RepID=A0A2P7QYA1_9SPHN|nr:hypothetical protein [Sphingomonas deserti]PSJ42923.1 hypothetical protein C7I55_00445 [Sphingomonas deserti]